MVLGLQLDTRRLPSDHEAAQDLSLHPDLAVLPDDDALGLSSHGVAFVLLHDVYPLLVRNELLLALPRHADARSDLVT